MHNDAPFLLSKEDNNASLFFRRIMNAAQKTAYLIGKGHENWEEVADNFTKWCKEHNSSSGKGSPYKFYYTNYSVYNGNLWRRISERLKMMFGNYPFVIHLIRDRCMDNNAAGGYVIQIHCYKPSFGSYRLDYEMEDQFIKTLYDCLCQLSEEAKCPCSMLTNPSFFDRVKEWLIRCYIRYNSFCYGLYHDIKSAIQGTLYQPSNNRK